MLIGTHIRNMYLSKSHTKTKNVDFRPLVHHEGGNFFRSNFSSTIRWVNTESLATFLAIASHFKFGHIIWAGPPNNEICHTQFRVTLQSFVSYCFTASQIIIPLPLTSYLTTPFFVLLKWYMLQFSLQAHLIVHATFFLMHPHPAQHEFLPWLPIPHLHFGK